nr:tRNA-binding protein [Bacteroidota bacterium]
MEQVSYETFAALDIRVGTVLEAEVFDKARKPALKLKIDFGVLGIKKSSAQITDYYTPENLIGKQIVAVVNFAPRQIADFMSECLVLGIYDLNGAVVLLQPERAMLNGQKIG